MIDVLPYGELSLGLTGLFLIADRERYHPRNVLVFAIYGFLLLTFFSMIYAIDPQMASRRGQAYLNWLILFFLTVSLVNNERRFILFLFLYLLWNFKMSFFGARIFASGGFSFSGWGLSGPQGWFQNSGEFGLQMAIVCVLTICMYVGLRPYLDGWRKWAFLSVPVTAFISTLGSLNRGDYLALGAGLIWIGMFAKGKRVLAGLLVLTFLGGAWWLMPDSMVERFDVVGDDYTSYTRETRWWAGYEIFKENPVLGVGTGSWVPYYSMNFPREIGREGWGLPHNSFIEVIGEHGSFGLLFFFLIFAGMFLLNRRTRKLALATNDPVYLWISRGLDAATVAFLVGGNLMSVFFYPYVWVHAGMIVALNAAAQRRHSALRARTAPKSNMRGNSEARRPVHRPPGTHSLPIKTTETKS
ncbi:O-antigen ligase family protein [Aquisalimonas lutea]|uniref:O-antigen ligase family protein n=1 Tax=Aquisalimonas lutea TaxID=1327750 RepID=UPI0025B3C2D0|nr:O-antigen ligase family protein [Aquisalimonas lutea]MDN3517196.1 O-antigen ligase family protein [Aquisalimonas lutea]